MCTCVVPMGGRQHGNKPKWSRFNAIRPLLAIQVCLKSDFVTLRTGPGISAGHFSVSLNTQDRRGSSVGWPDRSAVL